MNQELIHMLLEQLGAYVKGHSIYAPTIAKKFNGSIDPTVVIRCISNVAIATQDPHSQIVIGIDLYTKDKTVDGTDLLDVDISEELEGHIDTFMSAMMGFRRTFDEPIIEDDLSIYHVSMQYTTTISDQRCHFF